MLRKILFILMLPFFSCYSHNNQNLRVEYYKSWTGYTHPVKLRDKIDSTEITNLNVYYIAKFYNNKLISVSKISNDTIVYKFEYKYDSEGNYKGKK